MKKDNKWLLWGLIGFTGILLVTAIILFFQLKKPAVPLPSPKPKPTAAPQLPPVQQAAPENVCQVSFTIAELKCTDIIMTPASNIITSGEKRNLKAQVTGGSGTYTHAWTVTTNKTNKGALSSTTTNPTDWTAPGSLTDPQSWTIKDTITDTSTTLQTVTCEKTLNFTGLTACFDTCDNDIDCETDLRCMTVGGDKRCVNAGCTNETDCTCTTEASPSPSPLPSTITYASPTTAPTPPTTLTKGGQPELPEAGITGPAVLGVAAGLLMILLALLF
ncbi:hypothetical protein L6272_02195 [Microgenomates group bacterium]|nr:hypothetical protein [Microgenomates group bacterium]